MDVQKIEARRIALLNLLDVEAHPLDIFFDLDVDESVAFTITDNVLTTVKKVLSQRKMRVNESTALATIKVAAVTPDKSKSVYQIHQFEFETLGTKDFVYASDRSILHAGEVEIHSHLFATPDYLGNTDIGDLIAAVEGPAWVHPTTGLVMPAIRIFGILSIYANRVVRLDFYRHNLADKLIRMNNYGLKRLGLPLVIKNAY